MEYQVLYRKFRPSTFSEVIGQEHITTVLKHQVATGHVSHAYLFSGTRGTGKTSAAKILARAVNCLDPQDGEPCNKCEACLSSISGNVDIIELDAASNNRVDDMRALIEKAIFTPLSLKKKVYIIDEAHMLTQQAFNSLLKTLEEPPAHILFILATTEPLKIIPTITSRCQRFEFRRLKISDITARIKTVTQRSGAQIDDEGMRAIARKANGSMRDALSLTDQCISFCGDNVSADDVCRTIGGMDNEHVFAISDALIGSDAATALKLFDEACAGRDIMILAQDLTGHMRSVMLAKVCGNDSCEGLLDLAHEDFLRLVQQANAVSDERLIRALEILTAAQADIKYSVMPRVLIETALVKICRPEHAISIEAALDRIAKLEKQLEGTAPAASAAPSASVQAALNRIESLERAISSGEAPVMHPAAKPKAPPAPINMTAASMYKKLCAAVEERLEERFGAYLTLSLTQASRVEYSEHRLNAYFFKPTPLSVSLSNYSQILPIFESLFPGCSLSFMKDTEREDSDIESTILDIFDEIQIVE